MNMIFALTNLRKNVKYRGYGNFFILAYFGQIKGGF
jgi:hypothetical protein